MLEMNKVMLIGNLTRDPEAIGQDGAKFCIAMNKKWKDRQTQEPKEEACFVDITAWRKQAEFALKWLKKGSRVYVEGELRQESWDDKTSGTRRTKITVTGHALKFGDSGKKEDGTAANQQAALAPAEQRQGITREDAWAAFRDALKGTMTQDNITAAWTAEVAKMGKPEPQFSPQDWAIIAAAGTFSAAPDTATDLPF
jgi:single-strand DNA-binding protein